MLQQIANGEAPEDACASDVARIVAEQKETIDELDKQSLVHLQRARRHVVELESIASKRKEVARETLKILEQQHKDAVENEKPPTQRASEATTAAIDEAWTTYVDSRERPDDWECEDCRDECRERLQEEQRSNRGYGRYRLKAGQNQPGPNF